MTGDPGSAVLIAGPTASGKSALALRLAERLGATIVNADSMQVYRDLRIITARPTLEEEGRVSHRLYGHVDAAVNYSTGQWLRDVSDVLAELRAQGRRAILVGGTGLYFKALTQGLAAVPPIPADIRAQVRERIEAQGAPALHAELARLDSATAARLMVNDRSRICARARSDAGDRALAYRLASRRHAGAGRSGAGGESLPRLRAPGAGAAHRDALCAACCNPARWTRCGR